MSEKWIANDIPGTTKNEYHIEYVECSGKGLEIILSVEKINTPYKIKVKFHGSIESYRYLSKNYISEIKKKYDTKLNNGYYFEIENSEYLKWLENESYTITTELGSKHFAFIDDNSILDVVASYKPEFEVINQGN